MAYVIITIIRTRTRTRVELCVCLLCLKCQRAKYTAHIFNGVDGHVPRAPCAANRVNRPNERRKKAGKKSSPKDYL